MPGRKQRLAGIQPPVRVQYPQNNGVKSKYGKKNQEFTVSIEDMSEDGAGIGKLDGYIWFIKDAVIGDVVRARAMKMKKITDLQG